MPFTGNHTDIHVGDGLYPRQLLDLDDPPDVLHVIGDAAILARPSIAVLGSRRATAYGLDTAALMVEAIQRCGMPVVTGGGIGIAEAAMEAAIVLDVPCIAVLDGGLDRPYPPSNESLFQEIADHGGCIVSEQPDDMTPLPWAFRARNRIIAAISHSVLLVEAGVPSGTFSMVDTALRLQRDVYAVPGGISWPGSAGPNELIAMSLARCIDSPERLAAWLSHTIEKGA